MDPNHLEDFKFGEVPHAPPSEGSADSEASSADFVKIENSDFKNLPADFLAQYGNRVATDVLGSALSDNLRMDERDLYVPDQAGLAESHVAVGEQPINLDEFDPLAEASHHDLKTVPEDIDEPIQEKKVHDEKLDIVELPEEPIQHEPSQPSHPSPIIPESDLYEDNHPDVPQVYKQPDVHHGEAHPEVPHHDQKPAPEVNEAGDHLQQPKKSPSPPPKEPTPPPRSPTPVDNVQEEVQLRHHSPLTTRDEQNDYEYESSGIAEKIKDAVQEGHDQVGDLLNDFRSSHRGQNEDHYSPSGDSGNDTLGELHRNTFEEPKVMREQSPDLNTYDREGPLTFPSHVSQSQKVEEPVEKHEHHEEPVHKQELEQKPEEYEPEPGKQQYHPEPELQEPFLSEPRPPTPPKDLSLPGEVQPKTIDLGPQPASHGKLTHRQSSDGLHSILKHNAEPWVDFKSVHPCVLDILKWRDPKKSAGALALSLLALILIAKFSVISLIAWTSLLLLAGTLGFRVFKLAEGQLKKTDGSNPFKPYLEPEIAVTQEKAHAQADLIVQYGQDAANALRRLFLVENVFDSIKFGVLLWTLTYVGAWFSGICLATLFVIGLFTIPKVYEVYQEPIDEYVNLAKENVNKANTLIQEKLPFLKSAEKEVKTE